MPNFFSLFILGISVVWTFDFNICVYLLNGRISYWTFVFRLKIMFCQACISLIFFSFESQMNILTFTDYFIITFIRWTIYHFSNHNYTIYTQQKTHTHTVYTSVFSKAATRIFILSHLTYLHNHHHHHHHPSHKQIPTYT